MYTLTPAAESRLRLIINRRLLFNKLEEQQLSAAW
jgi:hypothetical protein